MKGVFNLDRSAKAIIAAVIAGATALATGWDDSVLTSSEKALAVGAAVTALGAVWAFSNEWAKAGIAAGVAGITALAAALEDDAISAQEWVTIVLAVLTALYAVYQVPNSQTPPPSAPVK
jgi:NADPH:quinone reductase-like Zn-dependent oxidoreductase